jgi:hypothetical protein
MLTLSGNSSRASPLDTGSVDDHDRCEVLLALDRGNAEAEQDGLPLVSVEGVEIYISGRVEIAIVGIGD